MARINIPFTIKQQHITQPTRETIVAGGQKYFYAVFTLCDKWEDIENLKAVFVRDDIDKLIDLNKTDDGYECEIPWEVMADKGSFQVGIFGGDKLLTDYAYVIVKQGCVTDGESPKAPTPDWFNRIEREIKNIEFGTVNTDKEFDVNSENPIANKVVAEAYNGLEESNKLLKSDVEGIQKQINEHAHFKGYCSTIEEVVSTEATPNDFAYCAETGTVWVYDGEEWVATDKVVPDQLTPASELTPLMDGEASVGTSKSYAPGDHRHPVDISRASAVEVAGLKTDVGNLKTNIIDNDDVEEAICTIDNNTILSYGLVENSIDAEMGDAHIGFSSALYFTTPWTIPANYSRFPADVYFKGDSTDNGAFVPEPDMRYTIVFDIDGYRIMAYVSGVSV